MRVKVTRDKIKQTNCWTVYLLSTFSFLLKHTANATKFRTMRIETIVRGENYRYSSGGTTKKLYLHIRHDVYLRLNSNKNNKKLTETAK